MMVQSADDRERLLRLLSLQADGLLGEEQWEELAAIVATSEEARKLYIDHMFLHAMMHRAARLTDPAPRLPEGLHALVDVPVERRAGAGHSAGAVVLDFLGDAFRAGAGFFSRSFVLTLLLAVGMPAILLLILVLDVMRQTVPDAVATVTRTHDCVWRDGSAALWTGTELFAGNEVRLDGGFAEITFARGGKVLLQGPAVLRVASGEQALLHRGSLVAEVGKGAEGFTVKTPSVAVVDLGTEFGVRVEDAEGTAEIEVFRGNVELRAKAAAATEETLRQRLSVGQAARVEVADVEGAAPVIRPISPKAGAFVRQMPVTPVAAVAADFSGGVGDSRPDQFPGTAGAGWATGWGVGKAKGLKSAASIDEANPLLGGGKYLRVLAERASGRRSRAVVGSAVDRRVALTDRVDLTKPYVVSFDLRIDDLGRFTEAGDRLSICARNVPQSRFSFRSESSSGWHVSIVGKPGEDGKRAVSGNWTFFERDAAEKAVGVDSGIAPRKGSVYSFRILVDPAARQWTPSIAVDGGKWTTFQRMGMRSKGTAEQNRFWAFLHFYYQLEGGNAADDTERIGFSVDSVRIVPQASGQTL